MMLTRLTIPRTGIDAMTDHSDLIAELRAIDAAHSGFTDEYCPPVSRQTIRAAADALSSLIIENAALSSGASEIAGPVATSLSEARAAPEILPGGKDCATALSEAREEIERLKKLSDRYGVALMMIRAGCSDPARFAGNILDDRQPVNVELDEEDFDENHR